NDRVGLILATDRVERIVPPKKGEKHVMRVVREILGYEPRAATPRPRPRVEKPAMAKKKRRGAPRDSEAPFARASRTAPPQREAPPPLGAATDLKAALEALVGVSRRRSIAFVISDFFAEGYERSLALASAKHDVIPVVLVDPRDVELPDVG